MPTITAQSLIDKAQILLQDEGATRWSEAELLGWLNDGQRVVCTVRPDASIAHVTNFSTAAGSKQALPAAGTALVDVVRTVGGNAIRKIDRDALDVLRPGWHSETAAAARHYAYDPRTPKAFYLWPPSAGSISLEIKYQAPPTDVAAAANAISIDDFYGPVLIDYLLFRSLSKEAEFGLVEKGTAALARFNDALGVKVTADMAVAPGATPNPTGDT
jgi:hypothetical protein